ncbi:MAG: sigma-70 family RNA polymerase sigma factor [Gammaproteobacteria bacterium]|nr:sigma-70 family RNA polymerase sigma factor [Gammaproteobacteria bacterium]
MSDPESLTRWLNDWVSGDVEAFERMAPVVYEQLRQIAGRVFSGESARHTLQPTALVHEAYERLLGADVVLSDRDHFYALAARMMRRLLTNHAKARKAAKRGGDAIRVTLHEDRHASPADTDVLALDAALDRLAERDQRKSQIIELNYFGGLTQPAIARVLGISESTARREQRLATLWLRKFLDEGG